VEEEGDGEVDKVGRGGGRLDRVEEEEEG